MTNRKLATFFAVAGAVGVNVTDMIPESKSPKIPDDADFNRMNKAEEKRKRKAAKRLERFNRRVAKGE